jgi:hypothetical protein
MRPLYLRGRARSSAVKSAGVLHGAKRRRAGHHRSIRHTTRGVIDMHSTQPIVLVRESALRTGTGRPRHGADRVRIRTMLRAQADARSRAA